ncbi:hypothetical protein RRF57_013046 [Xylaria bambusicola]|uniref:Uncharacterized protein n=1 Tax=Xylaria bambusicola TaxID=326684 RepID=A0AAN7V4W2_9PEZI
MQAMVEGAAAEVMSTILTSDPKSALNSRFCLVLSNVLPVETFRTTKSGLDLAYLEIVEDLVKVEAPPEYRDIAAVLSPSRVHEAETGSLHWTARRLGALFEGFYPKTPNLIKAYGLRAPEISREVAEAEKAKQTRYDNYLIPESYPPFNRRSLESNWPSGIPVLEPGYSLPIVQYKQFLLIAQNIDAAVHSEGQDLYSNTIHVWKTALSAMEGRILGRPHASRETPILLGLSAWHIFPDMVVFNGQSGSAKVIMKDSLVKQGGILSLGFSDPGPREPLGVYWSLSLAHHTFYGNPILQTRRLDSDGSRLTLDEFILVGMGSLLSAWRIPTQATGILFTILEAIIAIMPATNSVAQSTRSLSRPFKAYRDRAVLTTRLGRRRPYFVPVEIIQKRMPLFGLMHLPTLLYLLHSSDHKISLLRRLASRVAGLNEENSVILCFSLAREKEDLVFASAFAKPQDDRHDAREIEEAQFDEFCGTNLDRLQRKHLHEKIEYLESGDFESDSRPWFRDPLSGNVTLNHSQGLYRYLAGLRDDCEQPDDRHRCEHASLYYRRYGNPDNTPRGYSIPELSFEDVLWCFESGLVSSERLKCSLDLEPAFEFLKCLSTIYATYEGLASCGATINSAIVNHPFQPQILDVSDTPLT